MNTSHFPILILVGRPASGKSEIIDFLSRLSPDERSQRFHLAELDVIDDFPMLWTWFEEDQILSKELGKPRLHNDEGGYFLYPYLWDLLIHRLMLDYRRRLRDNPAYHQRTSTILEFSRGLQHGGYSQAFQHLSADLLQEAVVLYVNVSFEESLRKNRRRFNPDRPDSILEHAMPDEKLERIYRSDDWGKFGAGNPEFLHVHGVQIPYIVFENEDDVTTGESEHLAARLGTALEALWGIFTR
jgi:hypothetical protein